MASGYYYGNSSSSSYGQSYSQSPPPPLPLHLCFFLITLFLFIAFSWYMSYESAFESIFDQIKLLLMVSPLLLLLVLHCLSTDDDSRRRLSSFFIPMPTDRESFHRAGGSPWGVGLVLVILMLMISYQSYFHDRWFPLLSRR